MKNLITRLRLISSGVVGIGVLFGCAMHPASSKYLAYQTKTRLIYPLTGESLIGTGGRKVEQNPDHIYLTDQRFAMDIVALAPGASPPTVEYLAKKILSGEIKTYHGENSKNNDNYFCFGRLIVAPGDGVIIDAKDGVYDNIPGKRNTRDIPGNYVIIDHLNGKFSMLAHLKRDSVLVKKGGEIRAGEPIGQCGNSGHSNLPHLHYHLQNSPRWLDGEGLPAQFQSYYANGNFVERGEPIQGQIISHNP